MIKDVITGSVLTGALGSWCCDNDPANCEKYGRLYTWDAAIVACPAGWRLPTRTDWGALVRAVGGFSVAGTKLKSRSGWDENGSGTDNLGFSALPGGSRWGGGGFWDGYFVSIGDEGYWWTATEEGSGGAYYRYMGSGGADVREYWDGKSDGFSVRCVQE